MKPDFFKNKKAFSLVEVVVAVGLFALAIVEVIGLLAPTNKAIGDIADNDTATRVVSAIQTALQQRASASAAGFTSLGADLQAPDASTYTYNYYSTKSGDNVRKNSDSDVPENKDRFFEFALIRNTTLTPDNTGGFLAFTVMLRWPAYLPNGVAVPDEQKSMLIVPAAVTR